MATETPADLRVLGFEQRGAMFGEEVKALYEKYGVMPVARIVRTEQGEYAIPGIADAIEQHLDDAVPAA